MTPMVTTDAHGSVRTLTPARPVDPARRLRHTLRYNATFSMVGGVVAALAAGWVSEQLGAGSAAWVRAVGVGLVLWAVGVVLVARARRRRLLAATFVVIAGDLLWCAGTVVVIARGVVVIARGVVSTPGAVALALVAIVVGALALLQATDVRRAIGAAAAPDDREETIERRFVVPAGAVDAWSIVTDHELYGTIAPNLRSVVAESADGPGLTRVCTDRAGNSWSESCTVWTDGSVYEVAVDPDEHPAPVDSLRGRLWIEPLDDRHTRVGMRFSFEPTPGCRGLLFATTMSLAAPVLIAVIRRRWVAEARRRVAASA